MKNTLVLSSLTLLLFACSNPKDANETNFKTALVDYYATQKPCIGLSGKFPYTQQGYVSKDTQQVLDELVTLGLLKKQQKEVEERHFNKTRKVMKNLYTLTGLGNPISQEAKLEHNRLVATKFCYGDYEVTEVTNFTPPANTMGQTVSSVNFTIKVNNIADWAKKSKLLQKQYKNLAKDIASSTTPTKEQTSLVLTEKGWLHQRVFFQQNG